MKHNYVLSPRPYLKGDKYYCPICEIVVIGSKKLSHCSKCDRWYKAPSKKDIQTLVKGISKLV